MFCYFCLLVSFCKVYICMLNLFRGVYDLWKVIMDFFMMEGFFSWGCMEMIYWFFLLLLMVCLVCGLSMLLGVMVCLFFRCWCLFCWICWFSWILWLVSGCWFVVLVCCCLDWSFCFGGFRWRFLLSRWLVGVSCVVCVFVFWWCWCMWICWCCFCGLLLGVGVCCWLLGCLFWLFLGVFGLCLLWVVWEDYDVDFVFYVVWNY